MSRLILKASEVEVDTESKRIWVHNDQGITILRIQASGKLWVRRHDLPYSQIEILGSDIYVMLGNDGSIQTDASV